MENSNIEDFSEAKKLALNHVYFMGWACQLCYTCGAGFPKFYDLSGTTQIPSQKEEQVGYWVT